MFQTIVSTVRGWMQRMGLVKRIKDVSDIREIPVHDDAYENIEKWKAIYKGYFSEWHDLTYQTVEGHKKRRMKSLNMAKVLSEEMATLIFNEKCEVNVSNPSLAKHVKSVLDENRFNTKFQEYLEYAYALGGVVIKPYVEDDQIKLSYVPADAFIPISWDNQGIKEAVFTNQTIKGKKTYTLLEWHVWENGEYVIKNQLYVSETINELGKQVPLSVLYKGLAEEVPILGLKRSLFVYIHPNTANNIDLTSPLGIPIYANALDTMHSLDVAFDSFHREFVLGKRRIIVPASAIKVVPDPQTGELHRYFDAGDEVYQAMNMGDMDANKIHDNTVPLRVEEHIAAINALLNILSMQTGFSSGAFSFDGQSMKTATEVVSENSKTFRSKQSHEIIVEEALIALVDIIVDLASLYELFETTSDYETTIAFDDSIAEDAAGEINRQVHLVASELTSKKRAIMKIHKVSEEEAELMLQEIFAEARRGFPEREEIEKEVSFFGERE